MLPPSLPPPPPLLGASLTSARLGGKLTADLVLRSPQYMNCLGEYEIDLRGNKIEVIENLGVTKNQFDSIDLSDNGVLTLDGFPRLPRLGTLLLSNNRVSRIGHNLEQFVPNLSMLVLSNNALRNLADLDALATLPKLTHLSVLDNDVTKKHLYRRYAIHKLRHLRVLDFAKVKPGEREAADKAFEEAEGGAAAAAARTFEPGEAAGLGPSSTAAAEKAKVPPSVAKLAALRAALEGAATLEEVAAIEAQLAQGGAETTAAANGGGTGTAAPGGDTGDGDKDMDQG